jgi:ABC-type molybdenum transport system ATPase subunit/photorepair protein PhrA
MITTYFSKVHLINRFLLLCCESWNIDGRLRSLGRQGTSKGYDCNIRQKVGFVDGKNNLDCRGQFWELGNEVTPIIYSSKNLGTGFKPISQKQS